MFTYRCMGAWTIANEAIVASVQVSERIVMMDEDNRALKLQLAELEGKFETQVEENGLLLDKQGELYTEVQDKLNLLEAFEDKFTRQYRSVLEGPCHGCTTARVPVAADVMYA
jgi:hypothetical protein